MLKQKEISKSNIIQALEKLNRASRKLVQLTDSDINVILNELADLSLANIPHLLAENKKDLDRMDRDNPKYDRLLLDESRLEAIAADLRKVAKLPSPLNKKLEEKILPNGLQLQRVSVAMGVIGIIYESRPNVTFDVFALCLKSGNASVLKGSRDAHFSNIAIVALIHQVLKKYDLEALCYLAPSERAALLHILEAEGLIDLIIPRGGQGLINFVRANSKIPVIETGAGIVHTYYDKTADIEKGKAIITNAKSRRVSVCNALDTLVIHRDRLEDLPILLEDLDKIHHCEIFADDAAFTILKGNYDNALLHLADEIHFGTEFLSMKMSIKTVADIDEALNHVAKYSSKHSEAIIAEEEKAIDYYLKNTDAAVVYANSSTAFTDGGQFGMGAEIGISTQKLHARGPMALRELTSYKWIVRGKGQV
ncbi:MAG TPA: glutamate-5-semialdehyde dehydrogenase, partial [Saprospiraceae bacterium]|nr:glutamate-5-semialdehyde dehydrogenase [Saprospiraceae bacterium]